MMSSSETILLFGGSGKLGKEIIKQNPHINSPQHWELDITQLGSVTKKIQELRPDCIIHSAAVVGRKEAEADKDYAYRVNVQGTLNIARAALEAKTRLIYISSVSVFEGKKGNYSETDIPKPAYYYGWTKLLGELSVQMVPKHVIIRTDFFVPGNFKYSQLFSDHYCSKLPVDVLAKQVLQVARSGFSGVIHLGAPRDTLLNLLSPHSPEATPIKISESTMPDFPPDLSLDTSLYKTLFGKS